MTTGNKLALGLAVGLLVVLIGVAAITQRKDPTFQDPCLTFQDAYLAIELGMKKDQVEHLVVRPPPNYDPDLRQGPALTVEWVGIRGAGRAQFPADGRPFDPSFKDSLLLNEDGIYSYLEAHGRMVVSERETGKVIAVGAFYGSLLDELTVLYDPAGGGVIEKRYVTFDVGKKSGHRT